MRRRPRLDQRTRGDCCSIRGRPAASDLDERGRFKSAGQPPPGRLTINPEIARRLAVAYASRFGSGLRGPLEKEHQAPIDFSALVTGPRVLFAESPYDEAGTKDLHPGSRKRHGDYVFVELLSGRTPVLSVAVSVYNGPLLRTDHTPDFSKLVGNDFFIAGVPLDNRYDLPMEAEKAVRVAHAASGQKTSTVPRLVLPGVPESPFSAMWVLDLEPGATLRQTSDGRAHDGTRVLVHPSGYLMGTDRHQAPSAVGVSRDLSRPLLIQVRPGFSVRHTRLVESR